MIADVAEAEKADVDAAVEAARKAFDEGPWPRMSGYVSFHHVSFNAHIIVHIIHVNVDRSYMWSCACGK